MYGYLIKVFHIKVHVFKKATKIRINLPVDLTRRFSQIFVVFLENLNCTSNSLIQSPELQRHSVWFLVTSSSQEWQSVSWNFGKVQTFVSLWHLTYSCPNQDLHPVSEIKCNQKFYHWGPQHVGFKPLILTELNKCETYPNFIQNFQFTTMFIFAFCKICELNTEREIVFVFCNVYLSALDNTKR